MEEERVREEERAREARREREEEGRRVRDEEGRRVREEEARWEGLDEVTVRMIKDRIGETREFMEKELGRRGEEYKERIKEAKANKGKKK